MPISKPLLMKWRREALKFENTANRDIVGEPLTELYRKILRMTQELLDQHLLRK